MKDIAKSPRLIEIKRKHRKRILRLIIIGIMFLLTIIVALGYLSFNRHFIIYQTTINGVHIIDKSKVEKLVLDNLKGKYFYLFSKSNFLTYPHQKIYNDLLKTFTRIEKLSLYREGRNMLRIDIIERTGSYLYCGEKVPEIKNEIGENCYFVNNDGYIFDKAPYFSGNVYFKYYVSLNNSTENPLGSQVLTSERFHELVRFIDGIASLSFEPIYIIIEENGTHSLYLKTDTGLAPKIVFKTENNLITLFDNLSVAMSKKEFFDEINSKYDKLLYIDLRFKNKVLYKFQ